MAEITPITLLIGLAGAGKTTLLKHVLQQPEAAGVAVVSAQADPPPWWRGGCPCCAPRDDVARALRALLPRARRDEMRRVVIETTGQADPGPILATLLSDTVAASAYRLDGILTVVDAINGANALDQQESALRQVALADHVILTKTDGADTAPLRARLQRLNPSAAVTLARDGVVDPALVLTAGLARRIGDAADLRAWIDIAACTEAENTGPPTPPDEEIQSFCLTADHPLPWPEVSAWLERLILRHGDALLRMKAVLHLHGEDGPVTIHSARHLLFPATTLPAWPPGDSRGSRFMFITHGLPRATVTASFAALTRAGGGIG